MGSDNPQKVLITGGHETGGVDSFAAGLLTGFTELGIESEIIRPSALIGRWRELRDPQVLKILSTTGFFAAPIVRRAICIAHGHPQATIQGWPRMLLSLATFKLANFCRETQLIAVSDYIAAQLAASYRMKINGVVRNPVKSLYLERPPKKTERIYLTYVGRLVSSKNLDRLLPVLQDLINRDHKLRICIIGDGPQFRELKRIANDDERIEFRRNPDDEFVRDILRRTRVFISGNAVEGLGITYLEALSQGCVVAMPACGGGLELALEQIGKQIQLLPISLNHAECLAVLHQAINLDCAPMPMETYSPRAVAAAYLKMDSMRAMALSTPQAKPATETEGLIAPLQ